MLEASPSVLLVSLCDKLHNARAILMDHHQVGEAVWDRFAGKKEGTLWYYRSLLHAYGKHPAPTQQVLPLISELERVVSQLEAT
jgi:(p)ppGpp synthase/HD superfamily hydrolase